MREIEEKFVQILKDGGFVNKKTGARNQELLLDFWKTCDSMVNCYGIHKEEIAEALASNRMAELRAVKFALSWIQFWASQPNYMFDGRNEIAGEICRKLVSSKYYGRLYTKYVSCNTEGAAFEWLVGENAARMHRTLVQSLSGVLFAIISESDRPDVKKLASVLVPERGEKWYRMPLI